MDLNSIVPALIVFQVICLFIILYINKQRTGSWKIWKTNLTVTFTLAAALCMLVMVCLSVYSDPALWLIFTVLIVQFVCLGMGIFFAIRDRKQGG